jgi:acetylornithine/N-succinyldiaminopimelate aminotransferase
MITLSDTAKNLYEEKHFQSYLRFPVTFIKGNGVRVYDTNGKEYLDALAGIAVNSVGHCHPRVVSAIQEQAATLMHISNLYHNIPQSTLARLLTELSGFNRAFFCNSGLEANEAALKIVRKYGESKGKTGPVVYFTGCFHGRSVATLVMGKETFQKGFGPFPEGFRELVFNDVDGLDAIAADTKAVFVECVQGEGGINIATRPFMKKLSQICHDKGILLVVDEVQTGMGRTGKMFSYEHFGLDPDVVTLAKGLGAGLPIGAVLAKEHVAKVIGHGDHGSTFGGNPLVCAASIAGLEVILEERLVENARSVGTYLLNQITHLVKRYKFIKEVRGVGLMIGIDFGAPCRTIALKLLEQGLLVSCTAQQVIRIVPPLILTMDDADEIVEKLKIVLDDEANNKL